MYVAISIIILIACVLLSLIILVQNPKGGGLNASLGGVSNQVFGAKRSTDLVEKVTWYIAIAIVGLSLLSAAFVGSDYVEQKSKAETIQEEGLLNQPTFTLPQQQPTGLPE